MKIIHHPQAQRIDYLDERFYKVADQEIYYPSVTTVLEALSKGPAYFTWLKQLGMSADQVLKDAANTGTRIHEAIDSFLKGEEICWKSGEGKANYSLEEWQLFCRFVDFWNAYQPELVGTEITLIDDKYRLGGTIDILCHIQGTPWLIDTKTSNAIYDSHALQLAAYVKMWNRQKGKKRVKRFGVLHLKSSTKGPDKKGQKIQGIGWQLKEFDESLDSLWKSFEDLRRIWERQNPDYKPKYKTLPDRFKWEGWQKEKKKEKSLLLAG